MEQYNRESAEAFQAHKHRRDGVEWKLGYEHLLDLLKPHGGKTFLDVGCGTGEFSSVASALGIKVVGVDRSLVMLAEAKKRIDKVFLSDSSLHSLFAPAQFAGAYAAFSFCEMSNEVLAETLCELRRVIAPGGPLYILDPNYEQCLGQQYSHTTYHSKEGVRNGDEVEVTLSCGLTLCDRYRTREGYQELLAAAGFSIERYITPKPLHGWQGDWQQERNFPPYLLLEAR